MSAVLFGLLLRLILSIVTAYIAAEGGHNPIIWGLVYFFLLGIWTFLLLGAWHLLTKDW